jgi:hypothetical protein
MSKSSSPRGCIWHVDQVSQTPGWVGLGAGRRAQLVGWLARVWGGLACGLVATRLHEEEKPESVEATPLGRPATTWHQTDLSKSVEVPFTPIDTPLMWKSEHHTLLVVLHL